MQFALQTAVFGFVFGQYLLQVRNMFGWTTFAISTSFSVSQLIAGAIGPLHGWLIDKIGPRNVTRIGVILFGFGFLLLPAINHFWQFCALVLTIVLGTSLAGFLTLQVAIANWFRRNRGKAMAISSMGVGVGGVTAPVVAWAIVSYGWQPTALVTGVLVLLIGLPSAHFVRSNPEDMGLLPDGDTRTEGQSGSALLVPPTADFTVSEALADRAFWFVSVGHGVALIAVFLVMVHLVPHLVDGAGWSRVSAQTLLTLVTFSQLGAQLVGGYLGDRYSKTRLAGIAMLGHAGGMLLLAVSTDSLMVILAALLHGAAWGLRGPLMMAIRADYYGRTHFGKIAGYANVLVMLGPLVGPMIGGAMNDAFGNYRGAFLLVAAITAAGSLLFFFARKPPIPIRYSIASNETP